MNYIVAVLIGYLLGSIPFGLLLTKAALDALKESAEKAPKSKKQLAAASA